MANSVIKHIQVGPSGTAYDIVNQKVKVGTTTFDDNAVVSITGSNGVSVVGATGTNPTITVKGPSNYVIGGSQTTTSSADGGSNVFTFNKSDGTSATFTVKNGSKGSTGAVGPTGPTGPAPDLTKYPTLAGSNTFTGNNTFEGNVNVLGNNLYAKTLRVSWKNEAQTKRNTLQLVPKNEDDGIEYSQFAIEDIDITTGTKKVLAINHGMIKQLNFTGVTTMSNGTLASSYNLTLPQKAGTLALTSDLNVLPKLDSNNTFTGSNTFNKSTTFNSNINVVGMIQHGAAYSLNLPSASGTLIHYDVSKSSAIGGLRYDKASASSTDDWGETRTATSTTGHQSLAFGGSVHTYADWGVAFGADTRAYMKCSTVSGKGNQAGPKTTAERTAYTVSSTFGNAGNPARNQRLTHTWDYGDYADARASGVLNKAIGFASDAGNGENIAFGHYSTAKGYQNVAGGDHSTVIGSNNLASGKMSFAGGNGSIASGEGAVTFGKGTQATAAYATALGEGTIANTINSMVVGSYNDSLVNNVLFVVGNGTASQRNNAFIVHGDGRATVFTSPIYSNDVVRLGDLPIKTATLSGTTLSITLS